MSASLDKIFADIRACRLCIDQPKGDRLPHKPRPVLRVSSTARLAVCSQAPGTRVHASGVSFTDPSGVRLRQWMGVSEDEFYDVSRVAVVPMGFCFPGNDAHGGDLPPRKECAPHWHARLFALLPQLELVLLVGSYAQRWHLGDRYGDGMTDTVRDWRDYAKPGEGRRYIPLPHPSWRNNAWIKKNMWFESELLPFVRKEVRRLISSPAPRAPRSRAAASPDRSRPAQPSR